MNTEIYILITYLFLTCVSSGTAFYLGKKSKTKEVEQRISNYFGRDPVKNTPKVTSGYVEPKLIEKEFEVYDPEEDVILQMLGEVGEDSDQ